MAIVKPATSVLALSIVPAIQSFIDLNQQALVANPESTATDGNTLIANAIAYGIAQALSSPSFQTALAAGVGPATPGSLINTALQPQVIEA